MAVQCLKKQVLSLIFAKVPYQLAARLVLEDVNTAISKTQSQPSENVLSSRETMPANGEWSCGG